MKTDTQLQQDVIAELKWEPSVNAALVGVEVKQGVVTLTGRVNSYGEKWNAEKAAQRVAGVSALAVEITVELAGMGERTDSDIARSAQNVIQWTTYLPKDAVTVMVEKGRLTLTGHVDWDYQRQAAVSAVRGLLGVVDVIDRITLKAGVSTSAIKTDIEAVLKRRAAQDAQNISVAVNGGNITLTGTVRNWADRETARHCAWGTPGVHNVFDELTVSA